MNYPKPKTWNGKDLKGEFVFTVKIDGVRMLRDEEGKPVSRAGKPLYGLDNVPLAVTDAEIFGGDWDKSISLVRTVDASPVPMACVFPLFPAIDQRLVMFAMHDPSTEFITKTLEHVVAFGNEGLVLHEVGGKERIFKVKPHETYDVVVTGIQMGKGKHEGRVGALITDMGKVGTGFTDEQRTELLDAVGKTIEVECMQLTKDGKFRHPRFIRVREDK